MACEHRFLKTGDLFPHWEIEYLFVGTFNPEWDKPNGNNAKYFYGRSTNDFWYIMPCVFQHKSLMSKNYREDKELLKGYLKKNKIGLTDLIEKIKNADFNVEEHRNDLFSFKDSKLEKYDLVFNRRIMEIINNNNNKLKGVFFTRQIQNSSIICERWKEIKNHCLNKNIKAAELITPSRGYRRNGYTRDKKLSEWRKTIIP